MLEDVDGRHGKESSCWDWVDARLTAVTAAAAERLG